MALSSILPCLSLQAILDMLMLAIRRPVKSALMPHVHFSVEGTLSVFNLFALVSLVWKLHQTGLRRTYYFLFWYLVAQSVAACAFLVIPLRTNAYAITYFVAASLATGLSVAVVHELYRVALAQHPALSAAGRRLIVIVSPVAVLIAVLSLTIDPRVLPNSSVGLHLFFTIERVADFVILVLLAILGALMLWFPLVMKANVVLYVAGFAVHFAARAFGLVMANLLPRDSIRTVSNSLMGVTLACFVFWLLTMRRENETRMAITGHRWDADAMERLSGQLGAINSAVGRLVR